VPDVEYTPHENMFLQQVGEIEEGEARAGIIHFHLDDFLTRDAY